MQLDHRIKSFGPLALLLLTAPAGCASEVHSTTERTAATTSEETVDPNASPLSASLGIDDGTGVGFPNAQGVMMGPGGVPIPSGPIDVPGPSPSNPTAPPSTQEGTARNNGVVLNLGATKTTYYVGERVTTLPLARLGPFVSAVPTWTIAGTKVAGYLETPMSGHTLPFVNSQAPTWHWVTPGRYPVTLQVEYTVAANGVNGRSSSGTLSTTVTFEVLPPPFGSRPDATFTNVNAIKHDRKRGKPCELLFGQKAPNAEDEDATPGFEASLFVAGGTGTLRWTQLVHFSRAIGNVLADGSFGPPDLYPAPNPGYVLDAPLGQVGYRDDLVLNNNAASFSMDDSPGVELWRGKYYTANDTFRTFLMWKSPKPDAIFVPISRADWGWNAVARYTQGGDCKLDQGTNTREAEWADYPAFPEWDDNGERLITQPDAPLPDVPPPPPPADDDIPPPPPPGDDIPPPPPPIDEAPTDSLGLSKSSTDSADLASRSSAERGILTSGINHNKCLDSDGSRDGTSIHLWDCQIGNDNQAWTFESDGTIRAYGKCLDLANGNTDNEAKIQLYECSPNNLNQQWRVQENGTIKQSKSGKCVDVFEGNDSNGARIVSWDCHGAPNQKWTFERAPSPLPIFSGLDADRCLDVSGASSANGTPVIPYSCNGDDNQKWLLHRDGTIRSLGKCLDLSAGNTANGAKIQIWDCTSGNSNQVWRREKGQIKHAASGKCLDMKDGTTLLYDCDGEPSQQWSTAPPQKNTIVTAMGVTHCLDVEGGKSANGTPLELSECMGTRSQDWRIYPDGTIRTLGKCVDLSNGETGEGSKIQLWDCVPNNTNQQWYVEGGQLRQRSSGKCAATLKAEHTNGNSVVLSFCSEAVNKKWSLASSERYSLTSKVDSTKCLETRGGDRSNGTSVQIGNCNRNGNQDWRFYSDGTLRSLGKCVDVSQDRIHLEMWDCFPNQESQRWTFESGEIKQDSSGKCIDLPDANAVAGTGATLHDCQGQSNRLWLPRRRY